MRLRRDGVQIAQKFGLIYRLLPELQAMLGEHHDQTTRYNGDQSWELLLATYIVQPDGKISYARVDADWRKRPEPEEILRVLATF